MIFLGCLFDKNKESEILFNSRIGLQNAANTFQWNVIDGIIDNNRKLNIINVLPVGCYPKHYKKLNLNDNKWNYKNNNCFEIGCLNLPLIKQYIRYIKIKKLIKNLDDKNIIIYSTYLPFLKAVYKLKKDFNITLIVTDLPEFYDLQKVNFIKKMLRKVNNYLIYKYLNRVDKFVLLTEHMKEKLNVNDRPYIVVEGIYDSDLDCNKKIYFKDSKNIILYTGTLNYKFGIMNLIDAFNLICEKFDNYELWICGSGDAEKDIVFCSTINNKIKFYGYLSRDEVLKLQSDATVLVNPRPNNEEFTKYSFPSKTMEYLATGKPVIMHKLSGIPEEYDKYIYYVDEKENEAINLMKKLIEVCSKSKKLLFNNGLYAKKFIINNKSKKVQVKKIIKLIEE